VKPAFLLSLILLSVTSARAQSPEIEAVNRRIADYAKSNSEIMNTLEYLSDVIGPRLTGSAPLKRANDWAAEKMKEYGLENVHLESYTIPIGWERGKYEFEMIEPRRMSIIGASMAWTPNTKGLVTGPVVLFDPKDDKDLERFKGKLKNAIVLQSAPSMPNQHPSRDRGIGNRRIGGTDETHDQNSVAEQQSPRSRFLAEEGVAAVLLDSSKPQQLINMTGSWSTSKDQIGKVPVGPARVFVTSEHYAQLYRMVKRGVPVKTRIRIENRFIKGPVTVYNTVGEIKGSEKPDEVVLCGAHLDSWDLGSGTCDNGTGTVTVLEAARILKQLGIKPRRTIRFVLFSGEEQGLYGSAAYAEAHKSELAKINAVFVNDTGTGRVEGLGLHGNPQVQSIFEGMTVLKELGMVRYSPRIMNGTDHASFYPAGVPAFFFLQDPADYGWMHHTQSDTFDKALKDDLIQCAAVMAICAFNTSEMPQMLPRRNTTARAVEQ
jgi:hypothetical protein